MCSESFKHVDSEQATDKPPVSKVQDKAHHAVLGDL